MKWKKQLLLWTLLALTLVWAVIALIGSTKYAVKSGEKVVLFGKQSTFATDAEMDAFHKKWNLFQSIWTSERTFSVQTLINDFSNVDELYTHACPVHKSKCYRLRSIVRISSIHFIFSEFSTARVKNHHLKVWKFVLNIFSKFYIFHFFVFFLWNIC